MKLATFIVSVVAVVIVVFNNFIQLADFLTTVNNWMAFVLYSAVTTFYLLYNAEHLKKIIK